jgi:transaldolase
MVFTIAAFDRAFRGIRGRARGSGHKAWLQVTLAKLIVSRVSRNCCDRIAPGHKASWWDKIQGTLMKIGAREIKLFQDGADLEAMISAKRRNLVSGFTTNPTLMRKAGITDYKAFALKVIVAIPDLPISFEVFSDDFGTMEREACEIASWGGDTYVKLPITNTKGESCEPLIRKLSKEGLSLNFTAILTLDQVKLVAEAADAKARTIVSVFAGRIADTGVDPVPLMTEAARMLKELPKAELLWASPREVDNSAADTYVDR